MGIPDRSSFETAYAGQPPWDIGRPQPVFLAVEQQITGMILDAGCGTGDLALYLAGKGHAVTGIDFLEEPIRRAQQKAAEQGLSVRFEVRDALTLSAMAERYDTVLDSGLFHVFSDADRQRYVAGLHTVLRPGGRLFLICFSDAEPGTHGPRRVAAQELRDAFADGWALEALEATRFEVRPDFKGQPFTPGGPRAWFLTARRLG